MSNTESMNSLTLPRVVIPKPWNFPRASSSFNGSLQRLFLIGLIASLTGCADLTSGLQSVNNSLKRANTVLSDARPVQVGHDAKTVPVGQFGDGTGYQPVFDIAVPAGICDQEAFIVGFKDNYSLYWNMSVDGEVAGWLSQLNVEPKDTIAKKNLAMYKASLIDRGDSAYHVVDYSRKSKCAYDSYQSGTGEGMAATTDNWRALKSKALKRKK